MAGGPSTPELIRASGTFGFLPSGNIDAAQLRKDMAALSGCRYGVNLFAPQTENVSEAALREACEQLGVEYSYPEVDYTFDFTAKWEAVLESEAEVVSISFGKFTCEQVEELHRACKKAWVSVTSVEEAQQAGAVDALIVQGYEAGGHRLCFSPIEDPNTLTTRELVACIADADLGIPLVAAGGVRTPADVRELLSIREVFAVQCGSMFLLCPEAGTSKQNRKLLSQPGTSVASRTFSGRVARGLWHEHVADVPPTYPLLRPLTKHRPYCLVGTRPEAIPDGKPAAEVVRYLLGE